MTSLRPASPAAPSPRGREPWRSVKRWGPGGLVLLFVSVGLAEGWTPSLGVEPAAGVALSILLVAAVLWVTEWVPLFVTSFLILLLNVTWMTSSLEAGGATVASDRFTSPFFSDIILLFLGGFVLSSAFRKYGLDERLAQSVLARTGTRPARVLAGVMATTGLLSMWMSNTATTAMMLGLTVGLLRGVDDQEPFRKAMYLGIAFAANLGGVGTPIGTPPNAIAIRYLDQVGLGIDFGTWLLMALPLLSLLLVLCWFLLLRMYPPGMRELVVTPSRAPGSTPGSRRVALIAGLTVLGWLSGGLHGLSSGTVALLPLLSLFGLGLLTVDDFRQLPWDILALAGGGLSLGIAVADSGLAAFVVERVPVEQSNLVVAAGFAVTASLMSTLMSNTATANLLVPVAAGLPEGLVAPVLCVVAISCSVSMALPVTTPPNAMAFGSGQLRVADMARPGALLTVAGVAGALLSTLWWRMLGVF